MPAIVPSPATPTKLTGRDTEVGLLADRWEQAQEGDGQVVLIAGLAGLGKSRLVETARQAALAGYGGDADDTPIIEWRCFDRFQGTGLHPLVDDLRRRLAFDQDENPAARFDRLARYLDQGGIGRPEVIALFAKLLFLPEDERYPAPGWTPARERETTFRAVCDWLCLQARNRPLLFVVEDLQWIDASSLELLQQIVAAVPEERILAVLTFRPEFQPPWPSTAQQTSLALNRLTRRQVAELMRGDGRRGLPDSLVAQVYQRTGGVPLLVEEFMHLVRETAIFDLADADEMPGTLQELMLTRLDRMTGNRDIAHIAATLGREFHYDTLAAVTNVDEPTLQTELAKLTGADILRGVGQPPRCVYSFRHALLEEALRGALEGAQQRQFHRQVAEAMEARFPLAVETQPELLALHFTEGGVPEKAVDYWCRAGRRALERFANVEAINHFNKALELLHTLEETSVRNARENEILGPLGAAYIAARGYAAPEVGPIFARARELSKMTGPTPQAFVMLRGHFAYHVVRGDFRFCTELAAEAVELGERMGDPGLLMEALFLRALTQIYRGDFRGGHDSCSRALTDYDDRARTAFWAAQTGEDSGVALRCYLALACWHLGFADRAVAVNREARELARSLNHPFSLDYALHHTGWLYQHCRLGAETQAAGDEETRVATEQGFDFWRASGTLFSGAGLLLQERSDEGLRLYQNGLDAYRATGARLGLPYYLSILGEAFMRANRFDGARDVFVEALEWVEKNDDRFQEAEIHRLRGELHLAQSKDGAAAETCFQQALEVARRQGSRAWELRATLSLARLWHRQSRRHEAYTSLAGAFAAFGEGFETPDLMDAAALLKEWEGERMRDDLAAGIKYVNDCLPPPLVGGVVSVDWRYVPASTLGGDAIGYHWVDDAHLALYLIDVTGHGLGSALLSVTITNVIRAGSLANADLRKPSEVLEALNVAFQGSRHGSKFFTLWYGVYHAPSRTLTYASGGHPPAVAVVPNEPHPIILPATGPLMGVLRAARFPASATVLPPGAQLFVFSDGVFEVRRDKQSVWDLDSCIQYLVNLSGQDEPVMDALLARTRELRGSTQLDDDFSVIQACF